MMLQLPKPTHIQHTSRLSYDKMMNHFNELEKKGMIIYRRNNTRRIDIDN